LDVTDERQRRYAFTWDIDVLINNAAVGRMGPTAHMGPTAEMPLNLVRQIFEVNVFGNLALTQSFTRQMAERGKGRIVWVSSISGLTTDYYLGVYSASKRAIEAIAEAMYQEVKNLNITVAVINPGP
jgi:short-subunit dehydrogenase